MTLSLAACGGKTETPADTNTETPAEDTSDAAEPEAPAEDAEEADDSADAAAPVEGVPTYSQVNVGTDYTDLTATRQTVLRTERLTG